MVGQMKLLSYAILSEKFKFILNPVLSTLFSFFLVYCFTREVTAGQISIESFFL